MPNRASCLARILCRICVAAIMIWAMPASLWSQAPSSPQNSLSAGEQHFAGYDDSLTRAADALLASAAQPKIFNTKLEEKDDTGDENLVIRYDRRSELWRGLSPSSAEIRLDLLRPVIDPILRSRGVPSQLAAVIVIESAGLPAALSSKGARGLWQLMPDTARRYGLRVDDFQDDRLDLSKATDAAARYLHDLYTQFGDWKLALAAYNTGEANLGAAIRRAHTRDYEQLASLRVLPLETRNYVPRVLAAVQSLSWQMPLDPGSSRVAHTATVFASSNR